LDAK
jgi:hypothetical protein